MQGDRRAARRPAAQSGPYAYLINGVLRRVALAEGNLEQARSIFRDFLTDRVARGGTPGIAVGLEGMASVEVSEGRFERAAMLLGAAEAIRDALGLPLPPSARPGYEVVVSQAASGLGEEGFARARASGRTMSPDEAALFAVED